MTDSNNVFGARTTLQAGSESGAIYRIQKLEEDGIASVGRLPFSIKVLLEAALRQCDGFEITREDVERIARWSPDTAGREEIPFKPGRVVMQDFTGVPAVVDLAAMRDAMAKLGGDPKKVNPQIPVDLVIDHSVQVDYYGLRRALELNAEREFARNKERYEFLRWGQESFDNFSVVPPATGIVHQVNLEYLAAVVSVGDGGVFFPDSLVGTDSHTTMINGLGVVGWGVGGIEAEAVMLGQPIYMLLPHVVGFRLSGELPTGTTATDLVLTATQMLRQHGVVGKFVEFYGPGVGKLSLADRATLANMAPEYGATIGLFPVDEETLSFLRQTGRKSAVVDRVRAYMEAQGMLYSAATPDPVFSETLELDMGTVEPSLAGPTRPQDRVALSAMKSTFQEALGQTFKKEESSGVEVELEGGKTELGDGAVAIAAITSCTNTSNPAVMLGAGLLARNAVARGLQVPPYVKTSLAPGSRVVTRYLDAANVSEDLEALGFHTVGYGCTTCIGNSGPLEAPISKAINDYDLIGTSILSGNRNFEGRISPDVRANYLASPPLVVAYALVGDMNVDLANSPLGQDKDGNDVYLKDIWPTSKEVADLVEQTVTREAFQEKYADVFKGDEKWQSVETTDAKTYDWPPTSTYVQNPPYFQGMSPEPGVITNIENAKVLAVLGDMITTDHISPAGSFKETTPAGQYLVERQVPVREFNSYGSRRGNHEVMMRGTFANIRIKNEMLDGVEGGYTKGPDGEQTSIFDAAMAHQENGTPLVIFGGEQYGAGSSRDWAAKGTALLGVKAVIAENFERIHRSNLVGMGVIPFEFTNGDTRKSLGLTGEETVSISGLDTIKPLQEVPCTITMADGSVKEIMIKCRIDTAIEIEYIEHGGVLHYVLRNLAKSA